MPAQTVRDTWDIPCPFEAVPAERIALLLDAYAKAQQPSTQATAFAAEVTAAFGTESVVLETAAFLADLDGPLRPLAVATQPGSWVERAPDASSARRPLVTSTPASGAPLLGSATRKPRVLRCRIHYSRRSSSGPRWPGRRGRMRTSRASGLTPSPRSRLHATPSLHGGQATGL